MVQHGVVGLGRIRKRGIHIVLLKQHIVVVLGDVGQSRVCVVQDVVAVFWDIGEAMVHALDHLKIELCFLAERSPVVWPACRRSGCVA